MRDNTGFCILVQSWTGLRSILHTGESDQQKESLKHDGVLQTAKDNLAHAANRTRGPSMATTDFTTKPHATRIDDLSALQHADPRTLLAAPLR